MESKPINQNNLSISVFLQSAAYWDLTGNIFLYEAHLSCPLWVQILNTLIRSMWFCDTWKFRSPVIDGLACRISKQPSAIIQVCFASSRAVPFLVQLIPSQPSDSAQTCPLTVQCAGALPLQSDLNAPLSWLFRIPCEYSRKQHSSASINFLH